MRDGAWQVALVLEDPVCLFVSSGRRGGTAVALSYDQGSLIGVESEADLPSFICRFCQFTCHP